MSRRRLERLLNLTMCLMATSRFLTVSEIGDMVEGYEPGRDADEQEAFRRMFERDKQYLRDLGIPLETGTDSFGDEVGYRIRRDDYALPEIRLNRDEAAALALASQLWSSASLASSAASALRKLAAAGAGGAGHGAAAGRAADGGTDADAAPAELLGLAGLEPRVDATEPAFEPCLAAVQAGQAIKFPYRKPGDPAPTERHVEPWGVLSWRGRWYLAGHDRVRGAPRVFRLSRVAGPVRAVGPRGAVTVPPGTDLRAMVTMSTGSAPDAPRYATLAVRVGAGHALRRWARPLPRDGGPAPATPPAGTAAGESAAGALAGGGWPADEVGADMDLLRVRYSDVGRMARWVSGYGADVVVLDPPELRAEVIRRLRAVAEASAAPPDPDAAEPVEWPAAAGDPPVGGGEGGGRRTGTSARVPGRRDGTSDDRLSRLLALVPWLRARPGVSLRAAAEVFGITVRQLRDDLDLLFICGLPGGGPGDLIDIGYEGDQITVVDPQTLDRPLRLTADEATALIVAARALADVPGLAGREALESAVARIEQAIGSQASATNRVRVALDPPNEVLSVLQRALRDRRRVHLRYLVWSRDEITYRDVDPMRLLARDGHWYLEGWCHRAEAVRLFRLDSILGRDGVRVLDVPASPPPSATSRDTSAGLYTPGPNDLRAVLDVSPTARWVADHYPVAGAAELPDGGLRVTLHVASTPWLRRMLLGLGGDARVVAPPALAAEIHDAARKALAAYGPRHLDAIA